MKQTNKIIPHEPNKIVISISKNKNNTVHINKRKINVVKVIWNKFTIKENQLAKQIISEINELKNAFKQRANDKATNDDNAYRID